MPPPWYNSVMAQLCAIVGCGPTMGSHIARTFAGAGFDLALFSRSTQTVDAVADEARRLGSARVETLRVDATIREDVLDRFATLERTMGTPDVLIYNIATMVKTPPSELGSEEMERTLPAMFFGALYATEAVLAGMRRRGSGTLLYTGGGFGILPAQFAASHSVGKAALRNWVQNLYMELRDEGIHAGTVTITRPVTPDSDYDGAAIAEHYLTLHRQDRTMWEWEIIHKEL